MVDWTSSNQKQQVQFELILSSAMWLWGWITPDSVIFRCADVPHSWLWQECCLCPFSQRYTFVHILCWWRLVLRFQTFHEHKHLYLELHGRAGFLVCALDSELLSFFTQTEQISGCSAKHHKQRNLWAHSMSVPVFRMEDRTKLIHVLQQPTWPTSKHFKTRSTTITNIMNRSTNLFSKRKANMFCSYEMTILFCVWSGLQWSTEAKFLSSIMTGAMLFTHSSLSL